MALECLWFLLRVQKNSQMYVLKYLSNSKVMKTYVIAVWFFYLKSTKYFHVNTFLLVKQRNKIIGICFYKRILSLQWNYIYIHHTFVGKNINISKHFPLLHKYVCSRFTESNCDNLDILAARYRKHTSLYHSFFILSWQIKRGKTVEQCSPFYSVVGYFGTSLGLLYFLICE